MKKNEEIISLNTDLYDEFFVQELESRLETDPLTLGGLMGLLECNQCIDYCNCDHNGCNHDCHLDNCSALRCCGEYDCD
jgi:hypothetical protein